MWCLARIAVCMPRNPARLACWGTQHAKMPRRIELYRHGLALQPVRFAKPDTFDSTLPLLTYKLRSMAHLGAADCAIAPGVELHGIRVVKELNRGGTAVVYEGQVISTGAPVALKVGVQPTLQPPATIQQMSWGHRLTLTPWRR